MGKELTILTKATKEVTGNLPGGETVRYSRTYELGKGLGSVHAVTTREGRQVLIVSHQREGQVSYNFSAGDDFGIMEAVIDGVLSDIDDLYDEAGLESVRSTVENGIVTGVFND